MKYLLTILSMVVLGASWRLRTAEQSCAAQSNDAVEQAQRPACCRARPEKRRLRMISRRIRGTNAKPASDTHWQPKNGRIRGLISIGIH